MHECPRCHQRTFHHNLRYNVKEFMPDGTLVIHSTLCLQCKTTIDYWNSINQSLNDYFAKHQDQLLRLRQEYAANSGRRLTYD